MLQVALGQVREALQLAQRGAAPAQAALARAEAALRDEWRRLQDLHGAALSPEGIAALRDHFVAHGYAHSTFELLRHEDDSVLGWALRVR